MVERHEAAGFEEFDGECVAVTLEQPKEAGRQPQYHIEIAAIDKEIGGKTGKIHTWVRMASSVSETSLPRGSVADRFCEFVEDALGKEAKAAKKVSDLFMMLKGKKFHWKKKILGKKFEQYEATEYWVPVKQL